MNYLLISVLIGLVAVIGYVYYVCYQCTCSSSKICPVCKNGPISKLCPVCKGCPISKLCPVCKDGPISKLCPVCKDCPISKLCPVCKDGPISKLCPVCKDCPICKDCPDSKPCPVCKDCPECPSKACKTITQFCKSDADCGNRQCGYLNNNESMVCCDGESEYNAGDSRNYCVFLSKGSSCTYSAQCDSNTCTNNVCE